MGLGVGLLLVASAVGVVLIRTAERWRAPAAVARIGQRWSVVARTGVEQVGRVSTAAVVLFAGVGLTIAVLWAVGWPIKLTEKHFDVPVFEWFQAQHETAAAWWSRSWRLLTNIGGLSQTQFLTVAGALVLAVCWRARRWWVPVLVLPVAYVLEKTLQDLLKLVVDRGHPPTTLGSFPSGGCARVVLIYGLIVFLVLRWRSPGRRWWAAGWSFVGLCAVIQAYARTFNLEHWITDVFAGLLFGGLLLATMVGVVHVLDRDVPGGAGRITGERASRDDERRVSAPVAR
ncbi:phosphatase PAP2 family protein [Terrabacter aeriphilus]